MTQREYHQGDILYFDFSGSRGNEIRGIRPAVVISNDLYNENTDYIIVVPVTSGGTEFGGYVNLRGYRNVYGRVNATQIYTQSIERQRSNVLDSLREDDFEEIMAKINNQLKELVRYQLQKKEKHKESH